MNSDPIVTLLEQFQESYARGENPDVIEYCERAGDESQIMAACIQDFLVEAPEVELTPEAAARHELDVAALYRAAGLQRGDEVVDDSSSILESWRDSAGDIMTAIATYLENAAGVPRVSAAETRSTGDSVEELEAYVSVRLGENDYLELILGESREIAAEIDLQNDADRPLAFLIFPAARDLEEATGGFRIEWTSGIVGVAAIESTGGSHPRAMLGRIAWGQEDLRALASGAALLTRTDAQQV